ncbi:DSD1 family PLP-dependent enzyme [Jannaschia seohaensis]|uniref:3-hydroxy-D-aspartate aldolase n=1 Tax=Jannaschia seohaensis TaxID=475081 RepID=A0A2Y9AZ56_9RHOB|nr:DSD1 family PLP-dependent enzyme [Jannaschia seohaensis]PWJ15782.1 3-hydroxy-D-aspartate aldolase [Jannaschia seohaensis]SSA49461.1 3-hydroxy-D-aspartate aldolase [Jannaschia seohaensis]
MDLTGLEPGYDIPALPGMAEAEIHTPCLILDLDALERNLRRMAGIAAAHGVALRTHGKMHKSVDVQKLQQEIGGACGVCCQKVSEAEAFVRGGITDVLVSNEVTHPAKIARLAALPRQGARVSVCVDDLETVAALSAAVQAAGTELVCLVEIDCGANRCGVTEPAEAVALAQAVAAAPGLRFEGIQAYQGDVQHIQDHTDRAEAARASIAKARAAVDALKDAGLPCGTVTGGGTGSFRFEAASGVYTELQCGSYAFMDADYGRIEDAEGRRLDAEWENALFVLTSVMSHVKPDRAVVDAGHKSYAIDSGLPVVFGRDDLSFLGCSDEHGKVLDPEGRLKINDRLRLVPGHCDPTCNLHDWYVGLRGGRVETVWPVSARGKVF